MFCFVTYDFEFCTDTLPSCVSLQTSASTVAVRAHSQLQRVHRGAWWEVLHQAGNQNLTSTMLVVVVVVVVVVIVVVVVVVVVVVQLRL